MTIHGRLRALERRMGVKDATCPAGMVPIRSFADLAKAVCEDVPADRLWRPPGVGSFADLAKGAPDDET